MRADRRIECKLIGAPSFARGPGEEEPPAAGVATTTVRGAAAPASSATLLRSLAAAAPGLARLELRGCALGGADGAAAALLAGVPLTALAIRGCGPCAGFLAELHTAAPSLAELEVSGHRYAFEPARLAPAAAAHALDGSDQSDEFAHVAALAPRLRALRLKGCIDFEAPAVAAALAALLANGRTASGERARGRKQRRLEAGHARLECHELRRGRGRRRRQ